LYSKADVSRVFGDSSHDVVKKRKSAMPDCPQITKKKRVKLEFSMDSTQKSSKISEVGLISKKKFIFLLDRV
jgi:hypothetical protein